MTFKEIYYAFIYGLVHSTVIIRKTPTTFSIYGNISEARKGRVPSRTCGLYFTETSKGPCLQFSFKGEFLDNIWKYKKYELYSSELSRININNIIFDNQVKVLYEP